MTIDEASKKYGIPMEILREYEAMELCATVKRVMGAWQYDNRDLERLSIMMTLYDIGFTKNEVDEYMRLLIEKNDDDTRIQLLNKKRTDLLDEIHFKEKNLEKLDYLRYKMKTGGLSK